MIEILNDNAIRLMEIAGKILKETLDLIEQNIKPGVSTKQLDEIAENYIISKGGIPSCKGYEGYPASICASVNEVIVHGIPSNSIILKNGDIISIDIVVSYKGYHADAARTYPVGEISADKQKLIDVTKECFYQGLAQVVVGNKIGDVSYAIQKHAESHGYSLVRELTGHGIGSKMHQSPDIPNFGAKGFGQDIKIGMGLAIEPMVLMGSRYCVFERDGWTCRTRDRKCAAHYENTVIVTKDGLKIITL